MHFERKADWDGRREQALNRALEDRSRLAAALQALLDELWSEYPDQVPGELLTAELQAKRALAALGTVEEKQP